MMYLVLWVVSRCHKKKPGINSMLLGFCLISLQVFAGPPCENCNRTTFRNPSGGYICRYCNPELVEAPENQKGCSDAVATSENAEAIECIICLQSFSGYSYHDAEVYQEEAEENSEIPREQDIYLYCCESHVCENCLSRLIREYNAMSCPRCRRFLYCGVVCPVQGCMAVNHPGSSSHLFNVHLGAINVGSDPEYWFCPVCAKSFSNSADGFMQFCTCLLQHGQGKSGYGCPYSCCGIVAESVYSLVIHIKDRHSGVIAAIMAFNMISSQGVNELFPLAGLDVSIWEVALDNYITIIQDRDLFAAWSPDYLNRKLCFYWVWVWLWLEELGKAACQIIAKQEEEPYGDTVVYIKIKFLSGNAVRFKCKQCGYTSDDKKCVISHIEKGCGKSKTISR